MSDQIRTSAINSLQIVNEIYIEIKVNALALSALASNNLSQGLNEFEYLRMLHTARLYILMYNLVDDDKDNPVSLSKLIAKVGYLHKKQLQERLIRILGKYSENGLIPDIKYRRDNVFGHVNSSSYFNRKKSDSEGEKFLTHFFIDLKLVIDELNECFDVPKAKQYASLVCPDFTGFYSSKA